MLLHSSLPNSTGVADGTDTESSGKEETEEDDGQCEAGSYKCSIDEVVIKKKKNRVFVVDNQNLQRLKELSDCVVNRRKQRISDAHTKFIVGWMGCMSDNPVGMREFLNMYEDFIRVEGGGEIALE